MGVAESTTIAITIVLTLPLFFTPKPFAQLSPVATSPLLPFVIFATPAFVYVAATFVASFPGF